MANGVVYVGSGDYNIYALNACTGVLLWNYHVGVIAVSSPAVANGVVYIGTNYEDVYALNARTGVCSGATHRMRVDSSPAVANGLVYVGSWDHNVYALDASTGALLWSYTTGGRVESSPAVVNGIVYVGSRRQQPVYALNARTGTLLWSYRTRLTMWTPRPPWPMGWFMSAPPSKFTPSA